MSGPGARHPGQPLGHVTYRGVTTAPALSTALCRHLSPALIVVIVAFIVAPHAFGQGWRKFQVGLNEQIN